MSEEDPDSSDAQFRRTQPSRDDIPAFLDLDTDVDSEQKLTSVKVRAAKLAHMEQTASFEGWTGLEKDGRRFLLRERRKTKKNESQTQWLRRIADGTKVKDGKTMLIWIDKLLGHCLQAPKAPDLSGQCEYFTENVNALEEAIQSIRELSDQVSRDMNPRLEGGSAGQAKAAVESTSERIIPFLVLALVEAFCLGGEFSSSKEIDPDHEGEFTRTTLGIISYLVECISKLWHALRRFHSDAGVPIKYLGRLYSELQTFEKNVVAGMRGLEEKDPEHLWQAQVRDQAAAELQEIEAVEQDDAYQQKWDAFVTSTQRMSSAVSRPPQPQQLVHRLVATQPVAVQPVTTPPVVDVFEEEDEAQLLAEAREAEIREQEEAELQRIRRLKEADEWAKEQREAAARVRKEEGERRLMAFFVSTQKMRTG